MPRAYLAYRLPEEQHEHNLAVHGADWALAVLDLDNKLRNWDKYGHTFATATEAIEATRDALREILSERGVSLEDIA